MKYTESDVDYSEKPVVSVGANYYSDKAVFNVSNNLNMFSKTGWIGLGQPLSKLTTAEKLNISTVGCDAAFKWRGLYAQGEYFTGKADGQTSHVTLHAQGAYGQAGYFIIPNQLEIAARYAYLDPNSDATNDHWVESTGAVSWYVNKHNMKVQADYTNIYKQQALNGGPNESNDKRVRFQVQVMF